MSANKPKTFTPQHYQAIGRLVVACSMLELRVTEVCASLFDMDLTKALILMGHQQMANKIDTTKAYLDAALEEVAKQTDIWVALTEAKEVYDLRSAVVHSVWAIDENDNTVIVRASARGKFSVSQRHLSTQELLDLVVRAENVAETLRMIAVKTNSARAFAERKAEEGRRS